MAAPNWQNQTMWTGDNLDIMRGMNRASVDLIYAAPPFNSNANYAAPIGSKAAGAAFKDTWGLDDVNLAWHGEIKHENPGLYDLLTATRTIHGDSMMSYLIYMAVRLMEMHRLLNDTGSLYLHCDPTASHYLKLLLDCVFGREHFRNEVVWAFTGRLMAGKKRFNTKHNTLLFYAKTPGHTINPITEPLNKAAYVAMKKQKVHRDSDGREWIWGHAGKGKSHEYRIYLDDVVAKGKPLNTVWQIPIINTSAKERQGYPTQKPLALLRRVIQASSPPEGVVFYGFFIRSIH